MSYVFTGVAVGVHEDFEYNNSAVTIQVIAKDRAGADEKVQKVLGQHPDCTNDQCTEQSWKVKWKDVEDYDIRWASGRR